MPHDEIRNIYDTHPDMTLQELSELTGLPIPLLKRILLETSL